MGTREIPGLYKAKEGESLRILLTGGAGFQWTHLAEKWLKGVHKVRSGSANLNRGISGIAA